MRKKDASQYSELTRNELIQRLEEANEALEAIRTGKVDAIVTSGESGDQIYTLKDAQHPYRVMVDEMSEGAVILSLEGIILYCNRRFAEMLCLSRDSILGQPLSRFVTQSQLLEVKRILRHGLKTRVQTELTLEAGTEKIQAGISLCSMDLDGTRRLVALAADIQQLRQAEETIRCQADQYNTLLSTTLDGFWLFDEAGRILEINDAYCRMSGYSREELLKLTVADLEIFEMPDQLAKRIRKVTQTGFERLESRHFKKDHQVMDVELSIAYSKETGQFIQFTHDISGRIHKEQELRDYRLHLEDMVDRRTAQLQKGIERRQEINKELMKSEMRYRELVEYAPTGICELNLRTNKFISVNDAMIQMIGYTRDELLKMNPFDLLAPDSHEAFHILLNSLWKGENPDPKLEYHMVTKNSGDLYVQMNVSISRGLDEMPFAATIVSHNITDRKQYEEQLKGYSEKTQAIQ